MRNQTTYEWVCELEDDYGDIVDCRFGDTREQVEGFKEDGFTCRIALVKHEGNQIDGEVARGYAYVDENGGLPDEFDGDCDPRIPKRFRDAR